MEGDSFEEVPTLEPKRKELLGDIKFDTTQTAPLGGLNPHNPHFDKIGSQFHNILVQHAKLTRSSRILEIGCGTGRLAKPLLKTIDGGTYIGFDVNQHFIDYCTTTYQQSGFKFERFDIAHEEYNRNGTLKASEFKFPWENGSFDLVVAIAVFNHLDISTIFQYIRETSRVLKPKGIFVFTAFLLNRLSMQSIAQRTKPPHHFSHQTEESWHDFKTRPWFNVAHPEEAIRRVCVKSNLMIREPINYGEWCGSQIAMSGPDVVMTRKGGWLGN